MDWLPASVVLALAVAAAVSNGELGARPLVLVSLGGLAGLAVWQLASAAWSPFPAAARDEALLTLTYAVAFAGAALVARSPRGTWIAPAAVAAGATAVALDTALRLRFGDDVVALFFGGRRLAWPIDYPNAQAAAFLIGFWPAVALAARRPLSPPLRVLALASASLLVAGWVMTQSRGAGIAFAFSALVVFAVAPGRVRLFPVFALALVPALLSYRPLTAPFRADEALLEAAIHTAGTRALLIPLVVAAAGAAYVFLDRLVEPGPTLVRAAGTVVLLALVLALAGGIAALSSRVGNPVAYAADQFDAWKRPPERVGSSYLLTVGSNRYDVWRVAVGEWREHPVAGLGGRAFLSSYLVEGRTGDTPHRAHSVWLDALAETGTVGFVLLALGLLPAFALAAVARARADPVLVGALGTGAYWLCHATGDWLWTVPAVTLPFVVLLGSAVAPSPAGAPRARPSAAGPALGAVLVLLAVLAFAPPWLATRLTMSAGADPATADARLDWAERLDPLSTSPLVMRGRLAPPGEAPGFFERAVEREPRSPALRYLAGRAQLRAGDRGRALEHLEIAHRLAPNDGLIERALERARRAP